MKRFDHRKARKKWPASKQSTLEEHIEFNLKYLTISQYLRGRKELLFLANDLYRVHNCPKYMVMIDDITHKPDLIIRIVRLGRDYNECVHTIFRSAHSRKIYVKQKQILNNALLKAERIVKELTAKDKQELTK